MQFLHFILLVISMAFLALSAPAPDISFDIPTHVTNPSTGEVFLDTRKLVAHPVTGEMLPVGPPQYMKRMAYPVNPDTISSNPSNLFKRQTGPYCEPTGKESCNIAFIVGVPPATYCEVILYNYECDVVGDTSQIPNNGNFDLDSQLSCVVVGNCYDRTWCYGGPCHNPNTGCSRFCIDDTCWAQVTQCAFLCNQQC